MNLIILILLYESSIKSYVLQYICEPQAFKASYSSVLHKEIFMVNKTFADY